MVRESLKGNIEFVIGCVWVTWIGKWIRLGRFTNRGYVNISLLIVPYDNIHENKKYTEFDSGNV